MATEALVIDKKTGKIKQKFSTTPENGEATLRLTHMDVNGNVKRVIEQPSKSFVSNFARLLNHGFLNVANNSAGAVINKVISTTTGGATYPAANVFKMDVLEGQVTATTSYGVWIGDKDNINGWGLPLESNIQGTEGFDDYRLRGLIIPSGGAPETNMQYRANNISYIGGDSLKISRRFQNNSASSKMISECGIVGKSGTDYFMIVRDLVLGGPLPYRPITVEVGDIVVVEYEYAITAASGFTRNYLKLLDSLMKNGSSSSYPPQDILGNSYTVNFNSARTQMDLLANSGEDTHGIVIAGAVVGGTAIVFTPSTSAFKMANTKFGHSAGVFTYSAVTPIPLSQVASPTPGASYTQFGLSRDFENVASTAPVNVYETSLYMKEAAAAHYFMITRSGFSPYPVVGLGEILRVNVYFRFMLQNTTSEWWS
jgi:hypothetical protein